MGYKLSGITKNKNVRMNNIRNHKKIIILALISMLCLVVFTGCIPNGYTRKEKNTFLKEARKMAAAYLESTYSGAKVKSIDINTAVENMEYVLTEFATGQFSWQGESYRFVVDTGTGEVYTSVQLENVKELLCEMLLMDFGIDSHEAAVVNCNIRYLQGDGPGEGQLNWGWVEERNVFPEGKTAGELVLEILTDERAYSLDIDIQYKGGEIPQEILEEEPFVLTLEDIGIYHVAEDYELYEGERGYAFLPCLSEEFIQCSYKDDTAEYVRNQVLERDNLRVVYNAYERTRSHETISEKTIDERNIDLTVRDDYIALSCTKEHFRMYLLTTDRKIAQNYLYAFDYAVSQKKPRKGEWHAQGDYYIYSGPKDSETPYAFNSLKEEKNVIFSEENYHIF